MKKNRYLVWAVVALIVVLCFLMMLVYVQYSARNKTPEPAASITQPMSEEFLPVVFKSEGEVPTQISTEMAINPSKELVPGSIWIIIQIDENVIHRGGWTYDRGIFQNMGDPSVTINTQCADPGLPSPQIGTQYLLNEWGVLSPVQRDSDKPLQRFIDLEYIK